MRIKVGVVQIKKTRLTCPKSKTHTPCLQVLKQIPTYIPHWSQKEPTVFSSGECVVCLSYYT